MKRTTTVAVPAGGIDIDASNLAPAGTSDLTLLGVAGAVRLAEVAGGLSVDSLCCEATPSTPLRLHYARPLQGGVARLVPTAGPCEATVTVEAE